ncbi:MAG: hypothetical protein GWN31_10730 [Candidatus Thorarchaeota archaeon]|nr:hypothetical protein [Candidatus Thorarchaeota archaeon]
MIQKSLVKRAFEELNELMEQQVEGIDPLLLWYGCPIARWDNADKKRVFAHTNHIQGVVCVTERLDLLQTPFVYGILAHEFGHELAIQILDDDSEKGADTAALSYLGLPIHYGTEMRLQYLEQKEIKKLQGI